MKVQKISTLFGLLILLVACSGQVIDITPANTTILSATLTPKPSITSISAQIATLTPDACTKQAIPANEIGVAQSELFNDKFIAYDSESEKNSTEIYIADWGGQNEHDITNHPASDASPKWSSDGKQIAFLSNRHSPITAACNGASDECMYELFVVNRDGTDLKQITKGWTFSPSWSPDGKQFVFLHAFKSDASPNSSDPFLYDIEIVNSDGSNWHNLTNSPGYYDEPMWSPDGEKIAFISGDMAVNPNSINIINRDGTGLIAYSNVKGFEIVWAADSNSLFFTSMSDNNSGYDIYKLKADLSDIEQLTFIPDTRKDEISLSPDGKWLAYHSQLDISCDQIRALNTETLQDYFVYDARDIEKIILDENGNVPLYSGLSISSITWTPDSSQLLFDQMFQIPFVFQGINSTFTVRLDGTGLKHLGRDVGAIQP